MKTSGWLRYACQLRLTFPLRLKAYRKEGSLACGEKCNAFFILAGALADPELFICNEYIHPEPQRVRARYASLRS
jgi:hypothetical protein